MVIKADPPQTIKAFPLAGLDPTIWTPERAGKLDNLDVILSTRISNYCLSASLYFSNDTERTTTSTGGPTAKVKEACLGFSAKIRTYFELKHSDGSDDAFGRVFKNGAGLGTSRNTTSTTYISYSEDLAFAMGDFYQIYGGVDLFGTCYIRNQRVLGERVEALASAGY